MAVLVRIEAVNFGATLADTNDLSVGRGASLACLEAPRTLAAQAAVQLRQPFEEVFVGASVGLFRFPECNDPMEVEAEVTKLAAGSTPIGSTAGGADVSAEVAENDEPAPAPHLRASLGGSTLPRFEAELSDDDSRLWNDLKPVLPYLTFVVAAECPNGGDGRLRHRLAGRCRIAQLRQATTDIPAAVVDSWAVCAIDGKRPAAKRDRIGGGLVQVSHSVAARRRLGRRRKQAFYEDPYHGVGFALRDHAPARFARSLEDMTETPPRDVPLPVRSKVALVYLDGNDFTRKREKFIDVQAKLFKADGELCAAREFAEFVKRQRGEFMRALLGRLAKDPRMFTCPPGQDTCIFRFETLLWGGDEAAFVLPAFALPTALEVLADALADAKSWTLMENMQFTHKVGVHVADRKTPIAIARRMAEALADSAKKALHDTNALQLLIAESVDPPVDLFAIGADTIRAWRERRYGLGDPAVFTLALPAGYRDFASALTEIQRSEGGLPRSQLYGILRRPGIVVAAGGSDQEAIDRAFVRSDASEDARKAFRTLANGATDRLLPFRLAADLMDYFPPPVPERDA